MKLPPQKNKRAGRRQGSAVLILLILVGIATVLTVCNQMTLRRLYGELNLLEKRQQQKFHGTLTTNVVNHLRPNLTNVVASPEAASPAADFDPSARRPAR